MIKRKQEKLPTLYDIDTTRTVVMIKSISNLFRDRNRNTRAHRFKEMQKVLCCRLLIAQTIAKLLQNYYNR